MARKTKKSTPKTKARKKKGAEVLEQVKEPLALLNTLKEEGLANMMMFMGMASQLASGAAKNFSVDTVAGTLKEVVQGMGFASREDLERLEARIEELEQKLSEKEFSALAAAVSEDE